MTMQSICDSATSTSRVVIIEDSLNTQTALRYLLDAIGGLQVVGIESTAATAIRWAAIIQEGGISRSST